MAERKRLIWADSLKGALIMLVVLGHAIQYTLGDGCYENHLWNVIYSFHMPAFMAVSGFLLFRPNFEWEGQFWKLTRRRFRQLIVPYFAWTILLMMNGNCLSIYKIGEFLLYPDKGLWFLWVLFFITVLFAFCNCVAEKIKIKQEIVMAFMCLMMATCMVLFKTKEFGVQYIAYYFIFYSLGYFAHYHYKILTSLKYLLLVLLIVVWGVMAWFWQMQEIPMFLKGLPIPEIITLYLYRFTSAFIAIMILLVFSPKLLDSDKVWNKGLVNMGQISLGIYSINFLVLGNVVPWVKEMGLEDGWVIFSSFAIGMLIAWGIIWLLSKWRITATWLLGKI